MPENPSKFRLTPRQNASEYQTNLLGSIFGTCHFEEPEHYMLSAQLREDISFSIRDEKGHPIPIEKINGNQLTLEATLSVQAIEDNYPGDEIDNIVQRRRASSYQRHLQEALTLLGLENHGTIKEYWTKEL